jgi:HlyD family secretion protein
MNLKRQEDLWKEGLTTREALERAQNDLNVRDTEYQSRVQDIQTREQQILQEQAQLETTRYNLSQIIISAPMDGIVTRRNIEEGENVVVGTMNNPGTVLLTIADMSVIEAEIEVDETDIPAVMLNQPAKVTIDAVHDKTFRGKVTEIGNSPIQQTGAQATGQRQATNFKVVVTLEEQVPDVRPGFTCTAEITTATRAQAVSVPIQALTVREMLFDETGNLVHEPPPARRRRGTSSVETSVSAAEPPPGQTRKETEGVFVIREGRAVFVPVKVGIAGERHFEVLTGLREGDRVITGPFNSVRQLADGEPVKVEEPSRERRRPTKN